MIRIKNLKLHMGEEKNMLLKRACKKLKCSEKDIKKWNIYKDSLDARKKNDIFYIYTIDVEIKNKSKLNILLLFNSFKNSLPVHLFTTFISIIFCGLIILGGFILLEEPKNFINDSFSNLNYLTLKYNNFENNELIEKKYPNDIYKYVGGRIVNEEGKGVNFSDDINLMDYSSLPPPI